LLFINISLQYSTTLANKLQLIVTFHLPVVYLWSRDSDAAMRLNWICRQQNFDVKDHLTAEMRITRRRSADRGDYCKTRQLKESVNCIDREQQPTDYSNSLW